MLATAKRAVARSSAGESTDRIAYVLKGYPRTSETFILNEIHLLEQLGVGLEIFAVKKIEGQKRHAVVESIQAPVTYLPQASPLGEELFLTWLFHNVPGFLPAHARLLRAHPHRYLKTLAEMMAFSFRYRTGRFALPRTVFFKEFLQAGFIAAKILDAKRIRHIHAHFCHGATTIAMFVSKLSGMPFSFTAHAKDIYLRELNPGDLLAKKLQRAEFAVTCTGANKEHLAGICEAGRDVHAIYHGLDLEKFTPPALRPAGTPTILSVGRLVEKKGFDYLVKACRVLKDRGFGFRCVIVGGLDKYAEVIRSLIVNLKLEDTVTLQSAVTQEELKHIYEGASLFCLPCQVVDNGDRDGIPNVLAEAMAMELPVVSTNISGIPEIVRHGVNGLLVPEKDVPMLADAIEVLLNNPALGRKLGTAARRTICDVFDSRQNTIALKDLFVGCLEKR